MKKLQLVCALILITFISSCSKDDAAPTPEPIPAATNFAEIEMSHIVAKNDLMSSTNIIATNDGGILWPVGTVMIFKTNYGTYGKFEVQAIDITANYTISLNVVLFNADGTIKSTTNDLVINGTYSCDLDIPVEITSGSEIDFFWNRFAGVNDVRLDPKNGAVFLKYTF